MAANIPAGSQSDQHGKCPGSSDGVLGAEPCCPGEHQLRDAECPSLTAHITAGDVSADCYAAESITPETNHERVLFRKLVHRYTDELETVRKPCANSRVRPLDVMEIFCGPQSQLTHQCKQLGFQAERFGYQQGDLQTETGRYDLFHQ